MDFDWVFHIHEQPVTALVQRRRNTPAVASRDHRYVLCHHFEQRHPMRLLARRVDECVQLAAEVSQKLTVRNLTRELDIFLGTVCALLCRHILYMAPSEQHRPSVWNTL